MFAVELCRIIPPLLNIVMYRILYRGGVIKDVFEKGKEKYEREHKNEKSTPRQSPFIILMHRTADLNNIRMVHRHRKHRREQDPVWKAGCGTAVQGR